MTATNPPQPTEATMPPTTPTSDMQTSETTSYVPAEAAWPPVKSPHAHVAPSGLDPSLLPAVLRDWTVDEAERLGVPVEMVAVPALVASGALIGNTLRVRPKAHDKSWTETPNLYGAVIAPSATMKSPAIKAGMRFLSELDASYRDEHERTRHSRDAAATSATSAIREYEDQLATTTNETERAELESKLEHEQEHLEAANGHPRKLMTNDATIERVFVLLSREVNRSGLLLFREELKGLFGKMSSANHENDRPALLEGYDGKNSYDSERILRGNTYVPTFTLSLLGGIQPSMIADLVRETRQQRRDDGLLERMQATVWLDTETLSSGVDRAPNDHAIEQARSAYTNLASQAIRREAMLAIRDFEPVDFDDQAQEHFNAWSDGIRDETTRQRRAGNDAFASHLGKTIATAARLSLIAFELDRAAGTQHTKITRSQVERATGLTDFLIQHAHQTYRPDLPIDGDHMSTLWELLRNKEIVDGDSFRDVYRTHTGFAKSVAELAERLRPAETLGWVRVESVPNQGARPSRIIRVNPFITQPS